MPRKSKLTDKQWADIEKRIIDGEAVRPIAREYKISEAAIRQRLSSQTNDIKKVANQIVKTELAKRELPIASQVKALNLADRLLSMSEHLAAGADKGAAIYHRLASIAQEHVQHVDDSDPLAPQSAQALQIINILMKTGQLSAAGALELARVNRDEMDRINERESQKARQLEKRTKTSDPVEASRTYQQIMSGS